MQFNLFIPTTIEFSLALLKRLIAQSNKCDFSEKVMLGFIMKYINYLDGEFSNIEYRQSEKARAVVHCALARWSVSHLTITSNVMEETIMLSAIASMDKIIVHESSFEFTPSALHVHEAWHSIVQSLPLLSQEQDHQRRVNLEEFIVTAIGKDEMTAYEIITSSSSELDAGEDIFEVASQVKVVHSIPRNSVAPSASVVSPTSALTAKSTTFTVVESNTNSSSSSPVDVMNLDEVHKDDLAPASPSKRLDLTAEALSNKRQKFN
jgi:hypothetical protein